MAKNRQAWRPENSRRRPGIEVLEARTLLSAVPVVAAPAFVEWQRGTLTLQAPGLADSTRVSVNWGDGSAPQVAHVRHHKLTLRHTFLEEGSFHYAVTVGQARQPILQGTIQVADAPLTSARGVPPPANVRVGQLWQGKVASFADTNPGAGASEFTATIDWGDGTKSQATQIVADAHHPGRFKVFGQHTYTQVGTGPYAVSVTVQDKGGSTSTPAVSHFTVAPPPALTGTLSGSYLQSVMNPDTGTTFSLSNGSGVLAGVGQVGAIGSLTTTGFMAGGHAGGSLVLTTNAHETITLQLTGQGQQGPTHLPSQFGYTVTAVTEADKSHPADPHHLLHGTGTIDLSLTPKNLGGKPGPVIALGGTFTLAIQPSVS